MLSPETKDNQKTEKLRLSSQAKHRRSDKKTPGLIIYWLFLGSSLAEKKSEKKSLQRMRGGEDLQSQVATMISKADIYVPWSIGGGDSLARA